MHVENQPVSSDSEPMLLHIPKEKPPIPLSHGSDCQRHFLRASCYLIARMQQRFGHIPTEQLRLLRAASAEKELYRIARLHGFLKARNGSTQSEVPGRQSEKTDNREHGHVVKRGGAFHGARCAFIYGLMHNPNVRRS